MTRVRIALLMIFSLAATAPRALAADLTPHERRESAFKAVRQMAKAGQLPGLAKGFRDSKGSIWIDQNDFRQDPAQAVFRVDVNDEPDVEYAYYITRMNEKDPWSLKKAWRTIKATGKEEVLPLPKQ